MGGESLRLLPQLNGRLQMGERKFLFRGHCRPCPNQVDLNGRMPMYSGNSTRHRETASYFTSHYFRSSTRLPAFCHFFRCLGTSNTCKLRIRQWKISQTASLVLRKNSGRSICSCSGPISRTPTLATKTAFLTTC